LNKSSGSQQFKYSDDFKGPQEENDFNAQVGQRWNQRTPKYYEKAEKHHKDICISQ
jgi:hypothetical protein